MIQLQKLVPRLLLQMTCAWLLLLAALVLWADAAAARRLGKVVMQRAAHALLIAWLQLLSGLFFQTFSHHFVRFVILTYGFFSHFLLTILQMSFL